jgi:tyrosine-protein kinase Etk/Wzc
MEDQAINNSNAKSELWSLSFRDLFYKYVRFLPLFVLSVAFALLGAYMYLRYKVPTYSSTGSLIIKSEKGADRGDKFGELINGGGTQNIQSEIEILKSRPLMERVVKSLGLQLSYYAIGKIKTVNAYRQASFLLRPIQINDSNGNFIFKIKFLSNEDFRINEDPKTYKFNQEIRNGFGSFMLVKRSDGAAGNTYKVTWEPSWSAASRYAGAVQVMPKAPGTGILNITMRMPNPVLGADIINGLMNEYSDYSVEQKKISSEQTLAFIDGQMKDIGAKLDSTKKLVLDFQNRSNAADIEAQSSAYRRIIAESDIIVNNETMKRYLVEFIDGYLGEKKNEFSKVPSSLSIEDPTLNQMIGQYNVVQSERKRLLDANVPPANPIVKEIEGQIEKFRVNIRESLRNIKTISDPVISKANSRTSNSEIQLKTVPAIRMELDDRVRQVAVYEGLNKLFSDQKVITAIQKSSIISNSDIVNKAGVSWDPISPKKRQIQMMAILAGLLIPAMFIFLGEVLNDKVSTRFDIEKITSAPILGEIGHSYATNTLVVSKSTRSMVAEQFRIIRSNLQYVLTNKEKATILVTSSFSGEGKSYISTNIGAVLSLAGKKTVILEFDIRKPKVLSGLGMPKGPGISNFLVGKSNDLADLIKPVPDYENLFVLGCGPVPPNPSELLLGERVDELFAWVKNNFDMVIIDTAPVGMVSDAMTLGKYAEASLYLVRQGHTFKKQVALIDEFYNDKKLPKVSIILNDVKLKPGYGYYGYGRYGYGYGYGYGSYYEEETPPNNFFERLLDKLDIRKLLRKKKNR